MNTRLDYLWEKVSLFTQFSDLAKIFEPIFFKISLKTGPIFDHPLLVKIGSEIRKSVQNRKTDIFLSPGYRCIFSAIFHTGDNFCDFLLAFLYTSEYGVTLKGKNLFTLL